MTTQPDGRPYVGPGGQVLTIYICPRDAAAAIDWYGEVFGAVETSDRFTDPDGRVGHAEIKIDGTRILLSDAHPDYGAVAPEPGAVTATFALSVYVPDVDATMAVAEKAGATIQRPAEDQFYGSRMGTMIDPFGVRWMVNTHIREVSQEEMAEAVKDYSEAGPEPGQIG